MEKPNGRIILTKADFAEKTRQNRKATVGELEAGYNQMAADMERFARLFEARVARLEELAGIAFPDASIAPPTLTILPGGDVE